MSGNQLSELRRTVERRDHCKKNVEKLRGGFGVDSSRLLDGRIRQSGIILRIFEDILMEWKTEKRCFPEIQGNTRIYFIRIRQSRK